MPHTDRHEALRLALLLDVPFWPQLPRLGFTEDMYAQSLAGFPGLGVDIAHSRLTFSKRAFEDELAGFLEGQPPAPPASATLEAFLESGLSAYEAVRGQTMGPVSCGFRVIDERKRPVIYDDEVRPVLFEHLGRVASGQLAQLSALNGQPFIFMDEPGLAVVFSGLSGYNESRAAEDLASTLERIEGPVAIHLCGRPDWDFLLRLPIAMLSFNAFASGELFVSQTGAIASFLDRGGIICWGMVPTHEQALERFSVNQLGERLADLLQRLIDSGIDRGQLTGQSMLAPATCNLAGTPRSVEIAFEVLGHLSEAMKGEPL